MANLIGVTDLRAKAKQVIGELGDEPVTILSRSKPVAVLLRPDRYEALLDRLDELSAEVAALSAEGDTISLEVLRKELDQPS